MIIVVQLITYLINRWLDRIRYLQPLRLKSSSWLLYVTSKLILSSSIIISLFNYFSFLIQVGLQAELSYARSLARFAATLGPIAWKVASRRIEQALPVGCKFGRGWVGEYEPLPTPVLTFETRAPKESTLFTKLQHAAVVHPRKDDATHRTTPVPATDVRKDVGIYRTPVPAKPHPLNIPVSEPKSTSFCPSNGSTSEGRPSLFTPPAMPSIPPIRRDESSNAAAAAARAWMSIGAGAFKEATENSGTSKGKISADSLYNPTRELHPQAPQVRGQFPHSAGMHFQPQPEKNNFPLHGFPPQHVRMMNEAQFQNRPVVFPQFVPTDLSRFQVQPHWQGLSPRAQPRQKQDSLPPDLNIGFQSPGSPVKQSSGVLVDSQQPDLALQL